MAVLKAPLFSFAASGKLAKSLVYFGWKGLHVVRQYVIPTNPKSEAQTTQRITNFKAGVTKWHTFTLSALDLAAWSLLASTLISKVHLSYIGVMSNFNAFMRYFVDAIVADPTMAWNEISHITMISVDATTFWVRSLKCTVLDVPKMYIGTSKTYMPTEIAFEGAGGDNSLDFKPAGLLPSTKYFFYIKSTEDNCDARTGIYSQKTTAA